MCLSPCVLDVQAHLARCHPVPLDTVNFAIATKSRRGCPWGLGGGLIVPCTHVGIRQFLATPPPPTIPGHSKKTLNPPSLYLSREGDFSMLSDFEDPLPRCSDSGG